MSLINLSKEKKAHAEIEHTFEGGGNLHAEIHMYNNVCVTIANKVVELQNDFVAVVSINRIIWVDSVCQKLFSPSTQRLSFYPLNRTHILTDLLNRMWNRTTRESYENPPKFSNENTRSVIEARLIKFIECNRKTCFSLKLNHMMVDTKWAPVPYN